jgi:hypothetical protein
MNGRHTLDRLIQKKVQKIDRVALRAAERVSELIDLGESDDQDASDNDSLGHEDSSTSGVAVVNGAKSYKYCKMIHKALSFAKSHEAHNLISLMLTDDPKRRPPADACITHPFFWKKDKKLQFLVDVSNKLEPYKSDYAQSTCSKILYDLEDISDNIYPPCGWGLSLPTDFRHDLVKQRSYKYYSLVALLRAIRNKHNHFNEMDLSLKSKYFETKSGQSRNENEKDTTYVRFWLVKFPPLVIQVWKLMQNYTSTLEYYYPAENIFKYTDTSNDSAAYNIVTLNDRLVRNYECLMSKKAKYKSLEQSGSFSNCNPLFSSRIRNAIDNKSAQSNPNNLSNSRGSSKSKLLFKNKT